MWSTLSFFLLWLVLFFCLVLMPHGHKVEIWKNLSPKSASHPLDKQAEISQSSTAKPKFNDTYSDFRPLFSELSKSLPGHSFSIRLKLKRQKSRPEGLPFLYYERIKMNRERRRISFP